MMKKLLRGSKKINAAGKVNVEIERKFLLRHRPPIKADKVHKIQQSYIAREGGNIVRIRQKDDSCILAIKTPAQGIGRYEIEIIIKDHEADMLFAACAQPPIKKNREIYHIGRHTWELDIFFDHNKGLMIAEIELAAEDEEFDLPDWVGPEITGFHKFQNANLAVNPFKNWGISYEDLVARMTESPLD